MQKPSQHPKNIILHGFRTVDDVPHQAWFYSHAAAERFAAWMGWTYVPDNLLGDQWIEAATLADILADEERPDIVDTPESPWYPPGYSRPLPARSEWADELEKFERSNP